MASNYPSPPASPRRLDDLLICPVCLESFREPRTLTCLHTFCTTCLEQCRRAYRRDITCPVCKKVTHLPALGVHGLQNDFRVQQIKDILINQGPDTDVGNSGDTNAKTCDLCKTEQLNSPACHHCIQCFMYFCAPCLTKHNNNVLFSSHHVINMGESNATEVLFCRTHKEHPVRYFCKPCSIMMCTICTMSHDDSHVPEPLEKGIIQKYRKELELSLRTIKSKLSEVQSKTKYLETIKQTHQKALYNAQYAIRERTEDIVSKIKQREQKLLQDVQNKIDVQMKQNGIDNLGEIKFYRSNIETLYTEIESVIQGSPQQCLVAYEDLITRLNSIPDAPQITPSNTKEGCSVKFVPTVDNLDILIGTLEECSIEDDMDDFGHRNETTHVNQSPTSSSSPHTRKRTASILSAISPGRKLEVKIGKVKAFNSVHDKSPKSPRSKINADEALRTAGEKKDKKIHPQSPTFGGTANSPTFGGTASSPIPFVPIHTSLRQSPGSPTFASHPTSPIPSKNALISLISMPSSSNQPGITSMHVDTESRVETQFRLVFKVDQVGQWPGKITTPSGVDFLPDGNLVIAECENRLQAFDRSGHSIRIIGWGKVQPQRVAALPDGRLAVTDRKDKCVKIYAQDGDLVKSWGAGMFEMPTGIAVTSAGNYVITDTDRHTVSIHQPDGSLLLQFGSWGSGNYQFNSPAYVTVGQDNKIYISDSCNNCVKVFDEKGNFVRKFNLSNSKQGQGRRPHGLTVANNGNVIVVDRDNHRITMYTNEGKFMRHLMCKSDGLKYPCDVQLSNDNHIAVIESHSGFLTKDPHHCVKLFQIF